MNIPDSPNYADIRYMRGSELPTKLAELVELDKKIQATTDRGHFSQPLRATQILSLLKGDKHFVILAEGNDQRLLGYVLYSAVHEPNSRIDVVKLSVDPEFESYGIREQLVKVLHDKVFPDMAHSINLEVHVDDALMQSTLAKYGFKPPEEGAIVRNAFPDGGSAVRYRYSIMTARDIKLIPDAPAEPPPEHPPKNRKELLERMRQRLENKTGVAWEFAMPNASGALKSVELSHMVADDGKLRFRSVERIENPKAAYNLVCAWLGKTPDRTMLASYSMPASVVIEASAVRNIHLNAAAPAGIGGAFKVSSVPFDASSMAKEQHGL